MANFSEILNSLLGILLIIVVMVLAYGYLKPHRLHKRRLVSTVLLKASYLVYLFNVLLLLYLSIFFKGGIEKVFQGIESYMLLIIIIIPTVAILVRKAKPFSKTRDSYNYFFSVVNICSILALLAMYII